MSYLDSGFDNNLIRTNEYDLNNSSLLEAIASNGAIPATEITNALVGANVLNANNALIGDIINDNLNTATKEILGAFTFGASGAINIATDADNGLWLSPTGILAKKASVTTFALEADGDATFGGALTAVTGTLGALTIASGGNIKMGKTAYTDDTNAGFWLGDVSGTYKLNIGSSSTKYLHYDGTDLTFFGGTITGSKFQTTVPAAGTGEAVVIEGGTAKYIKLYYNADLVGYIKGYTTEGAEVTYVNVEAVSGRFMKLKNSYIEFDGDIACHADNHNNCGKWDRRWHEVWTEDLQVDDIQCNDSFSGCGSISGCAYVEINLMSDEQVAERKEDVKKGKTKKNYTGFELGDVLCYGSKGLKLSDHDTAFCVTAVAGKLGEPVVVGAEPIKVVGKVAINQFLVSSSIKGVARAWDNSHGEPPRGTVIAQSMEFKMDNEIKLIKAMIRKF